MSDEERRPEQDDDDLDWQVMRSVGTEEEATIIAGFLRANDIPAQVESVRFNQEPVNFGDMSEVRVLVPDEYQAQAAELLSDTEAHDLSAAADAAERAGEGEGSAEE